MCGTGGAKSVVVIVDVADRKLVLFEGKSMAHQYHLLPRIFA